MFEGNGERSVVSTWNELALEAIRLGEPKPTEITRALHMAHAAMYDAWAAYDPEAVGAYFAGEAIGPDSAEAREIAVSFAAFHALSEVFPDQVFLFRKYFISLGLDPNNGSTDPTSPEGIGNLAAASVIEIRVADGSNSENEYADTSGYESQNSDDPDDPEFNPNAWTPLRVPTGTVRDENGIPIATDNPASYKVQKPIAPHWGSVDPFAIADSDDYLPPAPPQLGDFSEYIDSTGKVTTGDAAYREQFGALVDISAGLTVEQKVIAEYWADGPQTSTPPGHWNEIAQDISVREGYGLDEDVKFFFALNNALFDAGIAIWDAKYTYDFVRPQTAIRYLFDGQEIESWGGPNQGTQTIQGEDWVPYQNVTFVTPAFPEYTSGHSGFSYAAATVIEAFTGSATLYDGTSTGAYDLDGDGVSDLIGHYTTDELGFENYDGSPITLTWDTVWDAAAEAGLSRLYGGIHIQDGDLNGRQIGADVARDVWAATSELFYMDDDNEIRPGSGALRTIHLGAGSDRVIGSIADLSGLSIYDFGVGDRIEIEGLTISAGGLTVRSGSAILEIDEDGDGVADGTITLEGDFDESRFIAMTVDGQTTLTVATNSDVELTEADERFITTDPAGNVVAAGAGSDVVVAEDGGDILDGDDGDDVLVGGAGEDVLIGGRGSDVTTGGGGGDIFSFDVDDEAGASGFTAEFITDFERGIDTVELSGFDGLSFETLTWNPTVNGLALILPGARAIVFEGIEGEDELSASDFAFPDGKRDVVFSQLADQRLTDANDRYVAVGPFADDVQGLDGDDALVTGEASDILDGGAGDDVLTAGAGDDELIGGPGSDTHTGGSGGDTFRFFGTDDPAGAGFVADYITDYEAGIDTIYLHGFAGIATFDDLTFATLADGLAANLGGGRFVVFEGLTDASQLDPNDFEFDGAGPELSVALADDTGTSSVDGITNNPSISGVATDDVGVAALELALGASGSFADVTSALTSDGSFDLSRTDIESALGSTLPDGQTSFTLRVTDLEGNSVDRDVAFTLDSTEPSVVSAPSGVLATAPDELVVTFSEAMSAGAFSAAGYALIDGDGASVEITSADRVSATTVRLNLADTLEDGAYSLTVPAALDLAGNALTGGNSLAFDVDAITRIVATGPTNGSKKANLDRKIFVEFDRPIDPATVDASSFQVIALGEPLAGRITVSSNGKIITFFPDDLLPAATQLRIKVDGDKITGLDGKPVDADGDGTPGGLLRTAFQTVTLTRIPDTNIEGFIFDANYRDENGLDIPLEGVVVSVVGLPGVTAVTDANGRFLLEDLPIPQVYLDFDASGVTNRPEFDYGTIIKPVDTLAGQTVGLQSGDKAFNIYFAALAEGDVTEIVEGQATEAGIGANGLQNLTEIFPNIDPSEWEKLKVTIPADSLSFDDGTLAQDVSVMVFEPDRIPAPLPPGFDPTVVFTVKAGDASNVDGKAQIDFPNLDNLAIGEKRPILSFDHDAGAWVQTGTAIVVDDGNGGTVLRSEGDTGVNTLGWKCLGSEDVENHDCDTDFCDRCDCTGFALDIASAAVGLAGYALAFPAVVGLGAASIPAAGAISLGLGVASILVATTSLANDPGLSTGLGFGAGGGSFAGSVWQATGTGLTTFGKFVGGAASGIGASLSIASALIKAADCVSSYAGFGSAAESASLRFSPLSLLPQDVEEGLQLAIEISDDFQESIEGYFAIFHELFGVRALQLAGLENETTITISMTEEGFRFYFSDGSAVMDTNGIGPLILQYDAIDVNLSEANTSELELVDQLLQHAQDLKILEDRAKDGQDKLEAALIDLQTRFYSEENENFGIEVDQENQEEHVEIESGYFRITDVLTGETISSGEFSASGFSAFVPKNSLVIFEFYDPKNFAYGFQIQQVGPGTDEAGQVSQRVLIDGISTVRSSRLPFDAPDTDGDSIPDIAENVIGLNPFLSDSDGDGTLDGAEIEQGLNPLDGVGFPTGVIGALSLRGEANDLTVVGDVDGAGQTAFVATGSHGLAIVDASQFSSPILLGELDLPGTAEQVSVDPIRNVAFVAAGEVGLHIVDVSDPVEPQLISIVPLSGEVRTVLSFNGLVLAGGSSVSLLTASGELLSAAFPEDPVLDIKTADGVVYVLTDFDLYAYNFDGIDLELLGSVDLPFPVNRRTSSNTRIDDPQLFIQNEVAYVSNGYESATLFANNLIDRGGYLTVDIADPAAMTQISNIDTPAVQSGFADMALNGSGLAVVASGFLGVQIHGATDPDVTYDILTQIPTGGSARAVEIASGIAYVADDTGGLKVINYRAFDNTGVPPEVSIETDAVDTDPDTPGIQVVEGETVRVDASVFDAVQVRNVELVVNGEIVLNDVSPPFDLFFSAPRIAEAGASITVEVRATDTGGNRTVSDPVVIDLVPDTVAPTVARVLPADEAYSLSGNTVITVQFSEPMDIASIGTNDITLQIAGENFAAIASDISYQADDSVVRFLFDDVPEGEATVTFDLVGATDRSGNALSDNPEPIELTLVDEPIVTIDRTVVDESPSTSDQNYLEFGARLSNPFYDEVRLDYRLLSATGQAGIEGDAYIWVYEQVVFAPGETSKTILIRTAGDSAAELDEAVVLQAYSVQGAAFAGGASTLEATGWILDVDGTETPLAAFVSRPNVVEGDAGETNAVFEVSFSRPIPEALTLTYQTVDGGAQAGSDYTAVSGTIDLVAGQTTAAIRVPVLGDTDVEFSETFTLSVSTESTTVAEISQGNATILDDDAGGALPTVSIAGASTSESLSTSDNNYLVFAVTLSEAATEEVRLDYRLLSGTGQAGGEGDAYIWVYEQVVFAPGETSKTILIRTAGDSAAELDEAVVLQAYSVQGAAFAGGASTLEATGWILDVDGTETPLAAFVSRPNVVEGDAGETNAVFEVSFSRPIPEALTLTYQTVDGGAQAGSDYTAVSGTIDLVAGQTTAAIRVPVLGDTDVEFSETFTLSVSTESTTVAEISQGNATILDDDAGGALPTVSIAGASTSESLSTSDNNYLVFAVTLSEAATEEVRLDYRLLSGTGQAGGEGDAYIWVYEQVVFAPGETSKTILIRTAGDSAAELDEAVVLQAYSVQGAAFAGGASTLEATGWILDVDGTETPLAAFVSRPNVVEGDAGETNAVFEVSFSRPIPEALTLTYQTVDGGAQAGSDYTAVSGTIDLVAGQTTAAIRVPVLGDTDVEFSETFTLSVSTESTTVAEISQGNATILDDDAGGALPTVSIAGASTSESLSTSDNNYLVFAVTLSEAATEEVRLDYRLLSGTGQAGGEGDAYIWVYEQVVFAPGETSKTILIRTAGDSAAELDEAVVLQAYSVQGAAFAGGASTLEAAGWILDVDGTETPLAAFVSRPNVVEGDAGETNAVFEVSFSRPIPEALTLTYQTVDGGAQAGSDYTAVSGTIDLVAGQTTAAIRVPVLGDTDVEFSETFTLSVSTESTTVAEISQGNATILDDDAGGALPTVSIAGASTSESLSTSDNNYLVFAVTLSEAATEEVRLDYRLLSGTGQAGGEGDAYIWVYEQVVFAPGETSKTILIRTAGDSAAELDEAVVLQAYSVQGAAFAGGASTLEAAGWILDVDGTETPLAAFVSRPNVVEGDAGETNAVFEVSFSRPIPEALTLTYQTVDGGAQAGSDYTAVSGTIDLVAGQTTAAIRVPVLGDTDVEFSETFTLSVSTESTVVGDIAGGQATIIDDDGGASNMLTEVDTDEFVFVGATDLTSDVGSREDYSVEQSSSEQTKMQYMFSPEPTKFEEVAAASVTDHAFDL